MSDLIRMYGITMHLKGKCRKCGLQREQGAHSGCDRWPSGLSVRNHAGIHYIGNSDETTVAELRTIVSAICAGEADSTPIQFDIRVRQILPKDVSNDHREPTGVKARSIAKKQ